MILVVDASPLITLARIGSLDLLHRSAERIVIPDAVYRESVTQGQGRPGSVEIAHADWVMRESVTNRAHVRRLLTQVGQGEAEAIALAQQMRADAVVLDDATARHLAEAEGCRVVGLLGLLIAGKHRGLLSTVKPLLDAMREAGFFIGDDLYTTMLRKAGEDVPR